MRKRKMTTGEKEAERIIQGIVIPKKAIPKNAPNPMELLMRSRYGDKWEEAMPYKV